MTARRGRLRGRSRSLLLVRPGARLRASAARGPRAWPPLPGSSWRRRRGRRSLVAAPRVGGAGPGRSPRRCRRPRALWRRRRRRDAPPSASPAGCSRPASSLAAELAAGRPPGEALDRAAAAWPPLAPGGRGVPGRRATCRRRCATLAPRAEAPRDLRRGRGRVAGRAPHRAGAGGRPSTGCAEALRATARHPPAGRRRAGVGAGHRPAGGRPAGAGAGDGLGGRRRPVGVPARPPCRAGLPGGRAGVRSGRALVDRGDRRARPRRPRDAAWLPVVAARRLPCPRRCPSGRRLRAPAAGDARRAAVGRLDAPVPAAAGACWPGVGGAGLRRGRAARSPGVVGRGRRLGGDRPGRAGRACAARREAVRRDLPHVVELFAATLRAGAAPGDGVAGRVRRPARARRRPAGRCRRPALARARPRRRSGRPWPTTRSWRRWAARWPGPHATGAPVVAAVERLADELARAGPGRRPRSEPARSG